MLILFIPLLSLAQVTEIKGKVITADGQPLFGVNVIVKGQNAGTITDDNGEFKIAAGPKDIIEFSYIGFVTQTASVASKNYRNITLVEDVASLNEVIVVGYGKTKRITNTGSVSSIKAEEIKYTPVSSVQNALAGRLPGFFSQQRSGQPGRDAADFYIRGVSSLNADGNKALIIVDDIEYNYEQLQQINMNEIESISILKDASTTAIYGIKGANGVLVVKTRRGVEGKPRVNFRMETGLQTPVRTPNFLGSYQTAQLVNEAYRNDGLNQPFSANDIELFRNGSDPYGHPDVDWYNRIFKEVAYQQNANVDISGGTKNLKYFITGGAFSQNGLVRDFSSQNDDINNNYFYRRFNFRSNLDYNVTKTLSFRLDMSSRFANINQPHNANVVGEIYDWTKIHPYSSPFLNPNGSYSYAYDTQGNLPTINARLANGGYDRINRTDSNFLFDAKQDLGEFIPGLSVIARFAYSSIDETQRSVIRETFPTYHYNPTNDTYTIDPRGNYSYGSYEVTGGQNASSHGLTVQGFINYDKTFGKNHHFNSTILYNRQSTASRSDVPANSKGYTGKFHYDYNDTYLIDFNAAYNGTDRFQADRRFGFFPSLGVGYSISEEEFFKKIFPAVQLLKIRSSYGLVGSDATSGGRYLYQQVYQSGGGYNFGYTGFPSVYEGDLGNNNVTWEKERKFNLALDFNAFSNFSVTAEYFHNVRFDQLVTRQDIPLILGVGISPSNVAKTQNKGYELQVTYRTKVYKDLNFDGNFTFSYAKNKILYMAEAQKTYSYLQQTGHAIGQPFGYTYTGYYTEQDIANNNDGNPDNNVPVPLNDVPIQPGDLKYKDLNGDGIINDFDKGAIGKPNLQTTTYGASLGLTYKGFGARVLFQGSYDYSFSVVGKGIEPFQSQFQPLHLQRWTPDNAENAQFPRLTTNPNTVNSPSSYMSNFWLIDAWYLRLKTVEVSYQFPERWLPLGISSARIYGNAYNLATWTSYTKYQQDPEISSNTAGDSYLNQKVVSAGVQIGF